MRVVVKIGTSSVTNSAGQVNALAIEKLVSEVSEARKQSHDLIVVTSGAITAGLERLGIDRPKELAILQAVSAVGQIDLMNVYSELFLKAEIIAGQVLLSPNDFRDRSQYLHAKTTFERLWELSVIPVVNENDAVADDAIRFGDNDRIAALVANLLDADLLVLLTDTPGLLTADPRIYPQASLVEEVAEVTRSIEEMAGGVGERGSGGMASKLSAAKIASWSGVRTVIADASRENVLADAISGVAGIGTLVAARDAHVSARKLWIGFALPAHGAIRVDLGAKTALQSKGTSLLAAGIMAVIGTFSEGDAIDITGPDGLVFAKGLSSVDSITLDQFKGKRTEELPGSVSPTFVHRDDLIVLS
ncbi:MAG: glutamate 5-kinase [Candidatus Poriferisodalaceae bacterium]|jgi:glutamate 5-kinase